MSASVGSLARLGVSLRWTLVRNRLRKGGLALFVVVVVLCAIGGIAGFSTMAIGRIIDDTAGRALLVSWLTVLMVGWTFAPLISGGADETVDPNRLALLPFSRREILAVMAGSAASSPAALAVLIALCGIVAGFAPGGLGAVLVVLAVPVAFALGLGLARLVAALLARSQRSRKGRDIAVLVTAGIGVTLWLGTQAIGPVLSSGEVEIRGESIVDALSWLPPGWIARSVVDARAGDLGPAAAWLAAAALLAGATLYCWAVMVERLLQSSERVANPSTIKGAPLGTAATPFQAALTKELLYVRRSPFKRVQLILGTVMGGGFCMIQVLSAGRDQPRVVFVALAAPIFALSGAYNLIGFDSASIWLDQVTGGITRAHLAARSISWSPHVFIAPAVVCTLIAAISGQWAVLPLALIAAFGVAACGLAIGLVISVLAPVPYQDGDNPFAWKSGANGGLISGLYVFGGLIGLAVITAPFVVPVIIWYSEAWAYLVAIAGVLFGVLLWWRALARATRKIDGKTPDLIAKLSPRSVA